MNRDDDQVPMTWVIIKNFASGVFEFDHRQNTQEWFLCNVLPTRADAPSKMPKNSFTWVRTFCPSQP